MDNRSLYMEYIDAALFDSYSKMNHCVQNDYYKVLRTAATTATRAMSSSLSRLIIMIVNPVVIASY